MKIEREKLKNIDQEKKKQTTEKVLFTFKNKVLLYNPCCMRLIKPICICDFSLSQIDLGLCWRVHV